MFDKMKAIINPKNSLITNEIKNLTIKATSTTPNNNNNNIGMVVDLPTEKIGGIFSDILSVINGNPNEQQLLIAYHRPEFLHFSVEEIALSADQIIRPVLCPKFSLPALAGYAEVINCGKSKENEDMAAAKILKIVQQGYEAENAIDLNEEIKRSNKSKLLLRQKVSAPTENENEIINKKDLDDEEILPLERSFLSDDGPTIPTTELAYFGIFDGHAGSSVAIMASKYLHEIIKVKLDEVLESILHLYNQELLLYQNIKCQCKIKNFTNCKCFIKNSSKFNQNSITADSLVIGALEAAFLQMDEQIGIEKNQRRLPGGCATIVALFFLNKLYIANAGDCRALLILPEKFIQLSTDFTPLQERKRLQAIGYRNNDLLGYAFSRLEYSRYLTRKDLNRKVLYRDWNMEGWAAKTVTETDLKPPLISSKGKKSRLLNTIGVSRGFGDHNLMTMDNNISIKPFLSAHPEVQIFDTKLLDSLTEKEVLIMASDGLWDVLTNQDVYQIVNKSLLAENKNNNKDLNITTATSNDETIKYVLIAQELAAAARGTSIDNCKWRMNSNANNISSTIITNTITNNRSGGIASTDDITVFVIPLKYALNLCTMDEDEDEDLLIT